MAKIEVKFLKLDDAAKLPTCNDETTGTGDSGYDIYAIEDCLIPPRMSEVVPTGINVAYITPGYWFKIEPRSGLGFKRSLAPHAGVIDNSYRGDLGVKIYNHGNQAYFVEKGDRIAQFVVYELLQPEVSWAGTADETHRGTKGFGSSGN